MTKTEALQQRKKLLKLIEQETRAEIIARLGASLPRDWSDYYQIKLDKLDEIRELVFGTSDFLVLGARWGLLSQVKKK